MAKVCNIHSGLTAQDAQEIVNELYKTYTPENIIKLDITKENSMLFTVIEIHEDGTGV